MTRTFVRVDVTRDQRVEVVLWLQGRGHGRVSGQDARAQ